MAFYIRMFCFKSPNATPLKLLNNLRNKYIISIQQTKFHNCNVFKSITPLNEKPQYNIKTIGSNIIKDVVLYKYENARQFKLLNIFAITQFFFWIYLSHFAYTSLKDIPVSKEKDAPWWRKINLGDPKYKNGIASGSFALGWLVLGCAWFYTLRSVRYLILKKGANTVSIVTYTPFGENRIMNVPLNKISAKESRENAKVQIPLKVENIRLHYILDMKGEFLNPKLFDFTAGLKRKLK